MKGRRLEFIVLIIVPILWITILEIFAYSSLLIYSFWDTEYLTIIKEFTLKNFVKIFTTPLYYGTILKTVGIGVTVSILALILGYPVAFFIAYRLKKYKNLLLLLIIMQLWISYLVRAYAWKIVLGTNGVINQFLLFIGVIDEPLSILLYSKFALILVLTMAFIAFLIIPVYAMLEKIPDEFLQASYDLGAGRFTTFWRVIFPLTLPGVIAGITSVFALSVGDFVAALLVGGPEGIMIGNIVWSLFGSAFQWTLGAANGLVLILLVAFILYISEKIAARYSGMEI
ncbi:MAG: binding-protein-dependent transport system inner membrane protein [Candidatus Dadabacteria bacterium CSP1-2]|jgi:spermidine/putrescine transport system permease protein|nr:MAG: binding-protein-dependent transport system inner membrane protein [Candidatus Dadabacteria bacterium CSP1-2]